MDETADALHIHTDGSLPADPQMASWALVVAARTSDGVSFGGGAAGRLAETGAIELSWPLESSTTAEHHAICWATVWISGVAMPKKERFA
eukprot:2776234-Pyramimonas_sp.AAC.1